MRNTSFVFVYFFHGGQPMNHFLYLNLELYRGCHAAYPSIVSIHPILTLSASRTFL